MENNTPKQTEQGFMKLYVYEDHLGGLYFDKNYHSSWLDYCEQCGDSDYCFGQFESPTKFIEWLKDEDGFIPYDEDYIKKGWELEESNQL